MGVLIRNGWEVYFHCQLFAARARRVSRREKRDKTGEQRRQLRELVKQLKAELPEADYLTHPDVKLLAAVMVGIKLSLCLFEKYPLSLRHVEIMI
jgi:toxin YhaV